MTESDEREGLMAWPWRVQGRASPDGRRRDQALERRSSIRNSLVVWSLDLLVWVLRDGVRRHEMELGYPDPSLSRAQGRGEAFGLPSLAHPSRSQLER